MRYLTLLLAAVLTSACSDSAIPPDLSTSLTPAEDETPIHVLVVTTTHGYRHRGAIDTAKALLPHLNEATEMAFTATENLADLERLDGYDVLLFANSTIRIAPEPEDGLNEAQQRAILEFIEAGGGFVGAHSALDACYGWDAYRNLVGGGLFHSHPWTQTVGISNELPTHPTTLHLGAGFDLRDEIYLLDRNPRPNSEVLLSLDPASVDLALLPEEVDRSDIPLSWTRRMGAGRVFMTKLGHYPEVWLDPRFLNHLLQGIRYAAGRFDAASHQLNQTPQGEAL